MKVKKPEFNAEGWVTCYPSKGYRRWPRIVTHMMIEFLTGKMDLIEFDEDMGQVFVYHIPEAFQ